MSTMQGLQPVSMPELNKQSQLQAHRLATPWESRFDALWLVGSRMPKAW